jgi:hypothetical protein
LNELEKNLDKGLAELADSNNQVTHLHDLLSSLQTHLLAYCSINTYDSPLVCVFLNVSLCMYLTYLRFTNQQLMKTWLSILHIHALLF